MRAHEAGALHGDMGRRGPAWLTTPTDINALSSLLWPRTVRRGADGALAVGGLSVRDLAVEFGTPVYVLDADDFRARCRDFRDAFAGAGVYYAAKAFCCKAIVRIVESEGLSLDVCTGGELAVALAAGMPPERIKVHGNNKSTSELTRALDAGAGCVVVDSFDEIARLTALARARGTRPRVMVRVTVGVEAHTHEFIATAHEDQKFGFSLASGAAFAAAERILSDGALELVGLHSHIGSQIFDTSGFEVSARRVLAASVSRTPRRTTRPPRASWPDGCSRSWSRSARRDACRCRTCPWSRAGRWSVRPCSRCTRSVRSRTSTASARTSASTAA
jgi:diaminopimelate decarboxylase